MKRLLLTIIPLAMACVFMAGCSDDGEGIYNEVDETVTSPSIKISQPKATGESSARVTFTPEAEKAVRYVYAIGQESDRDAFVATTFESIVEVKNGTKTEVEFTGLSTAIEYTIFARAYDKDNNPGPVASMRFTLSQIQSGVVISVSYLSEKSIAVTIDVPQDYYKLDYYLGNEDDLDGFTNGTIEREIREEMYQYTASFFDLTPDTEYTLFYRAYTRDDKPTAVFSEKYSTLAAGEYPNATLEVLSNDIYQGDYKFTPNEHCSKIVLLPMEASDNYFYKIINDYANWRGDVMAMLLSWQAMPGEEVYSYLSIAENMALDLSMNTSALLCYNKLYFYALLFDKKGNPFCVQRFEVTTPDEDPQAGKASVAVAVNDITKTGATYSFTPNSSTFAFLYDTVDADWFDQLRGTDEYYDTYLHDLFLETYVGFYYKGHAAIPTFTETAGEPATRYYAATCAMNANGPYSNGWGEMVLKEFTTLPE